MPRIPVYEQRLAPSNLGPQPRASGVPVADMSRGYRDLAAGIAQAGQAIGGALNQEAEDDANAQVSKALSAGRLYWNDELDKRSEAWSETGPSLRESFDTDFKKWKEEQLSTVGTPKARRYLEARFDDMHATYATAASNVDQKKRQGLRAARDDEALINRVQVVSRAPRQADIVLSEALAELEARGDMDPAEKLKRGRLIKTQIFFAKEQTEMNTDPHAWLAQRVGKGEAPKEGSAQGAPTAPATPSANIQITGDNLPAGMRNNNPFNIKYVGQKNAVGPSKNLDQGDPQAVYASHEEGMAAGYRLALKKYDGGKKSLNELIAGNGGWTPGNFDAAKNVAKSMGISPDDDLNLRNPGQLEKFGRALIKQEQGGAHAKYSDDALRSIAQSVLSGQPVKSAGGSTAGVGGYVELDTAPKSFRELNPIEREKMVREAQRLANHKDAVSTQTLKSRLQDAMAMAKDGIPDPKPMTRDQFNILGENADAAFTEYQRSQVLATDMQAMQGSTNADLMGWATGGRKRATPGDGYAAEDSFDSLRAQAAASILKKRADDPAGYVAGTVPGVNAAAKAAAAARPEDRPAATQRLVTETLAAQTALGITDPKILSDAQVGELSKRILGAKRPEDASDLVASLEAEFGKQHFPQVMKELAFKGELTPALMIIPDLKKPAARELVSRLAVTSRKDLDGMVDKDAKRGVEEAALEYTMRLRESMGPLGKAGNSQVAAYREMIERIAIDSIASGGQKNPKEAAKAAFDMLLGHYQFEDTLRMPSGVDAGRVRSGLKSKIGALDLSAADVPPSEIAGYKPDEALAQWNSTVRARGFWLADDATKRALLWARGANGVPYPVTKGGQQIGYSFEELNVEPAGGSSFFPGRQNMRDYEREQARLKAERMKAEREQFRAK